MNAKRTLLALFLTISALNAQVPPLLEYDGFLSGNITGNRTMGVKLYNASQNGTLLYSETIGTVKVTSGQYYFQYGQNGTAGNGTTPTQIGSVLTGSQNWLAVTVNGTELVPRERLLSVPFALRSGDAQTLNTQFGNLSANLTAVQGQTASLSTNLGTLQTQSANMSAAIGSMGSNLTTLRNQTTALSANLTAVQGQTASLSTNLGTLQTQSGVVDNELVSINTQLSPVTVSTLAGNASAGFADGNATSARFLNPTAVAVDSSGNVFVADHFNHRIRKITSGGVVTTLAGNGTAGFADGNGTSAKFNYPCGIAVDVSGNVYVGDLLNNRVRKITSGGVVTTLAGNGTAGFSNGNGTAARFNNPSGLAVDQSGNIYVADRNNSSVRKITSGGVVTTLAGNGTAGFADGNGITARFGSLDSVAIDPNGIVHVADTGNKRIRKISPTGDVTTFAGVGNSGFADGNGKNAMLTPVGVAVDSNGVVYVGDYDNNRVRRISPSGFVTTLAGNGTAGFADGTGKSSLFSRVYGLAISSNGILYVADQNNSRIRKIETSVNAQNLTNQVQSLSTNLAAVQNQTAALSSNLTTLQTQSTNMTTLVGSLGANLTTLQSQNTALAGNLTASSESNGRFEFKFYFFTKPEHIERE
jgi:sugar lactone lactonase YvrE